MSTLHHQTTRAAVTRAWSRLGRRATVLLALVVLAQTLLPHVHPLRDAAPGADAAYTHAAVDLAQHADATCPVCQALSHRPALAPATATLPARTVVLPWAATSAPPPTSASLLAHRAPRSPPAPL